MAGTADWGTATIGRLVLREGFTLTSALNGTTGFRTLTLEGEESSPPLTLAELKRRQEDIVGLQGRLVPVSFTYKSDHNGWYTIQDVDTNLTNWTSEVAKFSWTLQAIRLGAEGSVDLESRAASVVRSNNFSLTGERWHAPAGGAVGYFTGSTPPSGSVSRAIEDGGTVTVYRGIPAAVSPRWACSLANYQKGRARVSVAGVERVAEDVAISASAADWELSNSMIKVSTGLTGASLLVSVWTGLAWESSSWNITVGASTVNTWDAANIIRNDYEMVTLRLMKDRAPSGRVLLDLSVRRGAHFVEGSLQADTSTTLGFGKRTVEASTLGTGYIRSTSNDGNGNYALTGAPKSFTSNLTNGTISASASIRMDAYMGFSLDGSSAVAGNTPDQIRDQYTLFLAETTMGAPR
jgi:hypothetical protein